MFLRMRPPNDCETKEEMLAPDNDFRTNFRWSVESKQISLMQTESALNMSQSPMKTPTRPSKQTPLRMAEKNYTFDHCYDESVVNADVYRKSCQDIVMSSLQGINGTIFMYGQTGAGKTHTMLGDYSADILQHSVQPVRPKTPNRYNRKDAQELAAAMMERTPTQMRAQLSKSVLSYHSHSRGTPVRKTRKKPIYR